MGKVGFNDFLVDLAVAIGVGIFLAGMIFLVNWLYYYHPVIFAVIAVIVIALVALFYIRQK